MANITSAFVEDYKDSIIHLAQQGEARLRPHVMEVPSHGEHYNFDRMAPTNAVEKTARRLDTVYVDEDLDRRVASPRTFTHTLTFEREDQVQMIADPRTNFAHNQAMAMRRRYDQSIVEAATGTALDGTGANVAFPAGQVVGDGTGAISFTLVSQVQELFLSNDIMTDEPKVMVVGPVQVRQMMAEAKATSRDFVDGGALDKLATYGITPNFMGFTWIMSNLLQAPAAGELSCLAFTRQAIGLAVNHDVEVIIDRNPSKSYMYQVFAQWTAGCVRVEDEQIVHLHVLDS